VSHWSDRALAAFALRGLGDFEANDEDNHDDATSESKEEEFVHCEHDEREESKEEEFVESPGSWNRQPERNFVSAECVCCQWHSPCW
jgi:hypothetical protein